jgi:hypothetical protein
VVRVRPASALIASFAPAAVPQNPKPDFEFPDRQQSTFRTSRDPYSAQRVERAVCFLLSMEDVEQPPVEMGSIKLEDSLTSGGFDALLGRNGHPNNYVNGHTSDDVKDLSSRSTLSPDDGKRSHSTGTPDTNVSLKPSKKPPPKPTRRSPTLYDQLPDATEEAHHVFQAIPDCIYGRKDMGSSNHDALDCDCKGDWRRCFPS